MLNYNDVNMKYSRLIISFILFILINNCASIILKSAITLERSKGSLEIKKIQIENTNIVYSEGGNGEVLILVHGFGGDKDNWTRMTPYLNSKYRIISPDLPGFGDSDRDTSLNYSVSEQVKRLHLFLEKLGIKKFHIAGNSMGGAISASYSSKYPDEIISLILIDSAGVVSPIKSELTINLENGFNPLLVNDVKDYDRLLNFIFVKKPYIPDIIKEYFAEKAVKNRSFNDKIFKDLRSEKNISEESLSKIKSPTLIIWGDSDKVIHISSVDVFKKYLVNSKVVIMKDCGHSPQIERPEEVATHIKDFLSQR
jgi:abhydrolase domain-containing protein 6